MSRQLNPVRSYLVILAVILVAALSQPSKAVAAPADFDLELAIPGTWACEQPTANENGYPANGNPPVKKCLGSSEECDKEYKDNKSIADARCKKCSERECPPAVKVPSNATGLGSAPDCKENCQTEEVQDQSSPCRERKAWIPGEPPTQTTLYCFEVKCTSGQLICGLPG